MKGLVIGGSLNLIKNRCPKYGEEELEVIEYGLTSLYLMISKTIVICAVAFLLGMLIELIIFTVIYNIIRMPSFGIHATKSWICLVTSTIMFIGIPYICTIISIPVLIKVILGIIGIIFIYKNSPADTEKRPIVSPQRRRMYKYVSTTLAVIFVVMALYIPNDFLQNCFILGLLTQCLVISPSVYKLFGQPYDNYKKFA